MSPSGFQRLSKAAIVFEVNIFFIIAIFIYLFF